MEIYKNDDTGKILHFSNVYLWNVIKFFTLSIGEQSLGWSVNEMQ
jgi:hypothetical protein